MSAERRVEIERCLSGELRMEFDEEGRLLRAKAGTGTLRVDWQAGVAKLSNQYGGSSWSAGVSNDDWSYGTWEQSTTTPCSLAEYVDGAMVALRGELMWTAGAEVETLCRTWFSYGAEHGIAVGGMHANLLEFYLSTISTDRPEELIALARLIDRRIYTAFWAKILDRIERFPPKKKRLIRQELGLVPPKKAVPKPKPPSSR